RGVPAGQLVFGQDGRQRQVRVGVALADGGEHLQGRGAGRVVHWWPLGAGATRWSAGAPTAATARWRAVRAAVHARSAASRPHRSPGSGRAPRAQSAAGIGRLPAGCTVLSRTGPEPVPTSTSRLPAAISPGLSRAGR